MYIAMFMKLHAVWYGVRACTDLTALPQPLCSYVEVLVLTPAAAGDMRTHRIHAICTWAEDPHQVSLAVRLLVAVDTRFNLLTRDDVGHKYHVLGRCSIDFNIHSCHPHA